MQQVPHAQSQSGLPASSSSTVQQLPDARSQSGLPAASSSTVQQVPHVVDSKDAKKLVNQIKELAKLHSDGILDADEFKAAKAKLLSG